jgi:hypothetical protein
MRALRTAAFVFGAVLLLAAGGVLTLFLLRNAQWVVLQIPLFTFRLSDPISSIELESPLAVLLVEAFAVGCLSTLLLFLPGAVRRAVERSRERRFIRDLEGEIGDLRSLPVETPAPLEDLPEERDGEPAPAAKIEDDDRVLLEAALVGAPGGGTGPRPGPRAAQRAEGGDGGERPR